MISIHALRVEGDAVCVDRTALRFGISIHALRVEGDSTDKLTEIENKANFYPRPPGGGRQLYSIQFRQPSNFYPRPPGGGRQVDSVSIVFIYRFLSTPSGWRATA